MRRPGLRKKRRCEGNDDKGAAGLARAARVVARRAEQATAVADGRPVRRLPPDRVRRDSTSAVVGHRCLKVDVLGLGHRRVDLGRAVPGCAEPVRLRFHKPD